MLKLSTKRPYEELTNPPTTCSPHRIQFLGSSFQNPAPLKRGRSMQLEQPSSSSSSHYSNSRRALSRKNNNSEEEEEEEEEEEGEPSPFTPSAPFHFSLGSAQRFLPRKKPRQPTAEEGRLFTLEELRAIVNKVVAEREASLRQEYEATLNSKLEEQYNMLTQFNADHLDRRLKSSQFDYFG
ncbi:hypothetical protein QOT17_014204 [Balamuthia mandrillaris]